MKLKCQVLIQNLKPELKNIHFKKIAAEILKKKKVQGNFLIYIWFVSPEKIQKLNEHYRHIKKPTDVLSFPLLTRSQIKKTREKDLVLLGDIFICPEIVQKQIGVLRSTKNLKEEIEFLFIHGLKHLLGLHHR